MWHWQINGQSEPGEAHGRVGARGGKLWCVQVEKGEEAKARAAMAARTVSAADARVQSIDGCGCILNGMLVCSPMPFTRWLCVCDVIDAFRKAFWSRRRARRFNESRSSCGQSGIGLNSSPLATRAMCAFVK